MTDAVILEEAEENFLQFGEKAAETVSFLCEKLGENRRS